MSENRIVNMANFTARKLGSGLLWIVIKVPWRGLQAAGRGVKQIVPSRKKTVKISESQTSLPPNREATRAAEKAAEALLEERDNAGISDHDVEQIQTLAKKAGMGGPAIEGPIEQVSLAMINRALMALQRSPYADDLSSEQKETLKKFQKIIQSNDGPGVQVGKEYLNPLAQQTGGSPPTKYTGGDRAGGQELGNIQRMLEELQNQKKRGVGGAHSGMLNKYERSPGAKVSQSELNALLRSRSPTLPPPRVPPRGTKP